MAELFGRRWTRRELLARVGDVGQLGGARPVRYQGGPEDGVEAVEVRTGSGFAFTVLPGRGLDIGFAEFNGAPLCWRSSTGEIHPGLYVPDHEAGWLRGFYGGLMVTCGLTTAGWPSVDQGEDLTLHGPASYLAARNVHVDGEWDGDDYVMWVQGRVRETRVYGEDLRLTRRVWARLGESRFYIDDVVENMGFAPTPHMIAYHVNPGFPVLHAGSEFISSARETTPIKQEWAKYVAGHRVMEGPTAGWDTHVFHHRLGADADGLAHTALVNRSLPLGLYIKHRASELPWMWQWKQMAPGTYVMGMEPSNCRGDGRALQRERGELRILEPGERQEYHLEIGVLHTAEQIAALEVAAARARSTSG
jgi:hypothetical protein